MLPIYNKTNQVLIIFNQYPDWKLLNVTSKEEKINILKKLAETAIDKPIILSEDNLIDIPDESNIEMFDSKIIGYIMYATVDEENLSLQITGRIFLKVFLELVKNNDDGEFHYSNTCLLFNYNETKELFEISDMLENKMKEILQEDEKREEELNDLS